jgi:hypothetical protein
MERRKKRRILKISGIILLILLVVRLALPYVVLKYVNKVLSEMNGYYGHVEDIDIHLWRGAYTINQLRIDRKEKNIKTPFFKAEQIDLSVEWKAIWQGALVGEIKMIDPVLNFVASAPNGEQNDWREPVKKLFPLKINRLQVINGEVHYKDYTSSPDVDLYMRDVAANVSNLTNSEKLSKTLVANLDAHGKVMDHGHFKLNLKLDPYANEPTFDLNASVDKLKATELNNFFKAYGKFDVQDGTIGLYMEAAASKGKIKGYVKPIIENLNVLKPKEEKLSPLRFLYEAAIEGLAELFKNHPKDRIATRATFSGDLKNPKINVWLIVTNLLRNAFIHVLLPQIDQTIDLTQPGNHIEDDKSKKKQEKKEKKEKDKKEDKKK